MTEKKERRSPLKDVPVRLPGQGLWEQEFNLIGGEMMPWVSAALAAVLVAVSEWVHVVLDTPPMPRAATVIAAVAVVLAALNFMRGRRRLRQLRLGRSGEEAVGQFLEEKLRPLGYQVLHDIPLDRCNIDHVVIGTTGIYTVETKTHAKPAKGQCKITYDGSAVTVNGLTPDRDPVVQAKAQAGSLCDLLESSSGKRFKVQPVVLYPGWFVKSPVQWPNVWVQNEKQFPSTIQRQKRFIDEADVHLATYHLKRYVIGKGK